MINSGWRGEEMKCIANDSKCAKFKVFNILVSVVSAWHMDRESFLFKPNVKLETFKFLLLDQV